jgi:hypothetical protein
MDISSSSPNERLYFDQPAKATLRTLMDSLKTTKFDGGKCKIFKRGIWEFGEMWDGEIWDTHHFDSGVSCCLALRVAR